VDADNMAEEEYQQWQIDILNECFRVLKDEGSMFYNHKLRVHKNKASFPLEWIDKSDFIFRQLIVWDRGGSPNLDRCRYIPTTEYIFWLIKQRKNPRFKRQDDILFNSEVWSFQPQKKTKHPAPFPIELPDNIIPNVSQGERITVLDPFMGSGTVAISAMKYNCDYIGFEREKEYIDMARERIEKWGNN
jgi:modification methylase